MVITELPKNNSESFRISLTEFNGHNLCDLRVMANDGGELKFTKKGVAIPLRRLPGVIDALTLALAEARTKGMFNP